MLILGLETSCDETAAGVVEDGRSVLSNVVKTQFDLHGRYGGVVPELASRRHIEVILPVMEEALNLAGASLSDLDAVAVTQGPGLVGALLVGLNIAKAVSYGAGLPLVGVNHVFGHAAAGFISDRAVEFPAAAVVASGGHTNLYLVKSPLDFELLGQTRDDAAGEAFDKAAKMLGLGYPGGKIIDQLAGGGDSKRFDLPRPMMNRGLEFSFSGLKTALMLLVRSRYEDGLIPEKDLADLAASFQAAVVEVIIKKVGRLLDQVSVNSLILAGGVAANSALRREMSRLAEKRAARLILPPLDLCTDNGAMIAALGYYLFQAGRTIDLDADAYSRWPAGV